jgi:hypothetical protein
VFGGHIIKCNFFLCKRGSRCVIFWNASMPHLFFFFP